MHVSTTNKQHTFFYFSFILDNWWSNRKLTKYILNPWIFLPTTESLDREVEYFPSLDFLSYLFLSTYLFYVLVLFPKMCIVWATINVSAVCSKELQCTRCIVYVFMYVIANWIICKWKKGSRNKLNTLKNTLFKTSINTKIVCAKKTKKHKW